jgi:GNAT superfamily N-acetyltransferase
MNVEQQSALVVRAIRGDDSLEELTDLLHRAYAPLAALGLRFFASHQSVEQTRDRVRAGRTFVAVVDGRIVGTVTLYAARERKGPQWYRRKDIAYFGQFAIEPALQGRGYGNALLSHVEAIARADGLAELALDTAETAHHLIEYYRRHDFRVVEYTQWDVTNYRSVVMSKALVAE